MRRGYRKLMERKKRLSGKCIAGIDPASEKHQIVLLNEEGVQVGRSFAIPVSFRGYTEKLWKDLTNIMGSYNSDNLYSCFNSDNPFWY